MEANAVSDHMPTGHSKLVLAVLQGDHEAANVMLEETGADPNERDYAGAPVALLAARRGDVAMIRVLAEAGATLDSPDELGVTPVMMCSQEGHSDAVRVLGELRADLDRPDEDGYTPAHMVSTPVYPLAYISTLPSPHPEARRQC